MLVLSCAGRACGPARKETLRSSQCPRPAAGGPKRRKSAAASSRLHLPPHLSTATHLTRICCRGGSGRSAAGKGGLIVRRERPWARRATTGTRCGSLTLFALLQLTQATGCARSSVSRSPTFLSSARSPRAEQGTKGHKYSHKTAREGKFNLPHADVLYEQLHAELAKDEPPKPRPINDDLPGLGQFYCNVSGCVECRAGRRPPA